MDGLLDGQSQRRRFPSDASASKGKLPAAELALLRTWIVEGAVWEEVAQETKSEPKEETPSLSFGAKFWKFQGYFHPAVIHLPIALILGVG